MRIALITSEYITESNFDGGLANYLNRTALAFIKLGHEPIVIVSTDKNEKFEHNDVTVLRVDVQHFTKGFNGFSTIIVCDIFKHAVMFVGVTTWYSRVLALFKSFDVSC